jgi:hypothetical protein
LGQSLKGKKWLPTAPGAGNSMLKNVTGSGILWGQIVVCAWQLAPGLNHRHGFTDGWRISHLCVDLINLLWLQQKKPYMENSKVSVDQILLKMIPDGSIYW